jgi:hypothetical protein
VVGGVPSRFLVFIDPGWGNEFGYSIGGEDDRPVAFVDFGMMVPAQQTPVGVGTFAVMYPVNDVVRVAPGDWPVTGESAWGAVPRFRVGRFPMPLSEPDVRLSPHPALHGACCQAVFVRPATGWGSLRPGIGIDESEP